MIDETKEWYISITQANRIDLRNAESLFKSWGCVIAFPSRSTYWRSTDKENHTAIGTYNNKVMGLNKYDYKGREFLVKDIHNGNLYAYLTNAEFTLCNFDWALKQLNDGRKIRRKCWNPEYCIYFDKNNVLVSYANMIINKDLFDATDWELYEAIGDFAWAIEQHENGHCVQRSIWSTCFWHCDDECLRLRTGTDVDHRLTMSINDYKATDWMYV
jgi:hypothetical protein